MQRTKVIFWIIILATILSPTLGSAQDSAGLSVVQTVALDLASENCNQLSRNQACYGHDLLSADPQPGTNPFSFKSEGDIEDLEKIKSLRLDGLDLETGTWGIALLHLRANLPAERSGNVMLIAFGDVELQSAVKPPTEAEVQVSTSQYLNVRQTPSTDAGVIGALPPGQTVTAVERLEDSSWLRVMLPDSEVTGWVSTSLVTGADDLELLNTAARNSDYYHEPMQAFYFRSGADETIFSELPTDGLLIQTPEGVGEVQLLINEISIQLGSTVFFQAQANRQMTVSTLEGHADVRAFGLEQTAYAGTQVSIPLDDSLRPAGPPSPPQPYETARMQNLPIRLLQRQITLAPPMTPLEIQTRLTEAQSITSTEPEDGSDEVGIGDDNTSDDGNTGEQIQDCPGQSCNAPGQGGSCPGNSCNAPGQNKDDKDTGKKDK